MVGYLSGLLGAVSPASTPFSMPPQPRWNWQGQSGTWYMHSIFPLMANIDLTGANYIMVQRLADGRCRPIYIGQSENLRERLPRHEKLLPAIREGATELHVHLQATTDAERFRIETDIRNGQPTPLNDQSTPLYRGLLAALSDRI